MARTVEGSTGIVGEPTLQELGNALTRAVKAVKLDRTDLITILVQRSSLKVGNRYRRLTRAEVVSTLEVLEEVAKRYAA